MKNEGAPDGPDVEDLSFSWAVGTFEGSSLEISIDFDNPDAIS